VSVRSSIYHLHWLRVSERVKYKIAVLTYNAINVNKPSYLADVLHVQEHNRTTRSSTRNMLSLPFCKLKAASPGFCFAAPTVWNNLSEHVKSSASIDIFKERSLRRDLRPNCLHVIVSCNVLPYL